MENKYYTPEISEFYAGFEYEYKPRAREGLMSYVRNNFTYINRWDKDVFNKKSENFLEALEVYDRPYNIGDIYTYIEDKAVRVKYLDKEDIESFGFEYVDGMDGEYSHPLSDNLVFYKNIKDKEGVKCQLIFIPKKVVHLRINEVTIFIGKIKNKSELKKILQMTGVL